MLKVAAATLATLSILGASLALYAMIYCAYRDITGREAGLCFAAFTISMCCFIVGLFVACDNDR